MPRQRKPKFRSKFEEAVAKQLPSSFAFERVKLKYTLEKTYVSDFDNGRIFLECKGRFRPGEQAKMLAVKRRYPDLDIRFAFMKPNNPVRTGAKMTMAKWADKHGFKWCDGNIPKSWLK